MELQITGKNLEVNESLKALVDRKIGKLAHFLPTLTEAKVELAEDKIRSARKRYTVQVTVASKGILMRAEEKSENIPTALDNVSDAMAKQIKRFKEKRYDKGRGESAVRQTGRKPVAVETDEDNSVPSDVIRVKRFRVKPMPVSEATEQMELLGHDFFLFVNSETSRFNCLYRRKEGGYGLIEAELA
jgi:putative sigma-54 modulation protein